MLAAPPAGSRVTYRLSYGRSISRRALLPFVLVVLLGGCAATDGGDSDRTGPNGANKLTDADWESLATIDKFVLDWNEALGKWSATYKGGDREEMLSTMAARAEELHKASIKIRLSASQIENPKLRSIIKRMGNAFRRQFSAVVAVNNSVINADIEAGQAALQRLQRATEAKIPIAEELVDKFPELDRNFGKVLEG